MSATPERLLPLGAKEYEPLTERGPGFAAASVTDPFGNVLGMTYDRHHLDGPGTRP
ncbi:hypothetical protein ABT097_19395 [Streptomyces sp. NPDC002225]|uniref:VOC family protein n=1 Tax=Streptomyces sp. NPDC002225 TaxID=3154413 RepID=UPI00332937F9